MDYFGILPEDIMLEILIRVPTEWVLVCKLVCLNWRSIASQPSFLKIHFHHNRPSADASGKVGFLASSEITRDETCYHYFECNENHDESKNPIQRITRINIPPSLLTSTTSYGCSTTFVGSCDGLICFGQGPFVRICNPITREYLLLPEIPREDGACYGSLTIGFGYVSSTNDYKVVGIYRYEYDTKFVKVYIYTLGSGNGWRRLQNFNLESSREWEQQCIFANGALYWLDARLQIIITFNLADESFCEHLPLPPLPTGGKKWDYSIGVFGGLLYVSVRRLRLRSYDIWALKKKSVNLDMEEQEEHQSSIWSKEFSIDDKILFAVTKSDLVLTKGLQHLNIYDKRTSTSKRLVKCKDYILQVCPHQNTFLSLKELGEEDIKTMESVGMKKRSSRQYTFQL